MNTGHIRIRHTPPQGKARPEHNQIVIECPNGYEISIVYGALAYSSNRNGERFTNTIGETDHASAVEIAITTPKGDAVPFKDGETVKGFVPITELFTILNWVSTR